MTTPYSRGQTRSLLLCYSTKPSILSNSVTICNEGVAIRQRNLGGRAPIAALLDKIRHYDFQHAYFCDDTQEITRFFFRILHPSNCATIILMSFFRIALTKKSISYAPVACSGCHIFKHLIFILLCFFEGIKRSRLHMGTFKNKITCVCQWDFTCNNVHR